jgi:hypothetical protein
MSKEEAVQAALRLLQQAGIHAGIVRIYGSTTEAVIVLPEVRLPRLPGRHLPAAHSPAPITVVLDQ